jgi:hypothetical protein
MSEHQRARLLAGELLDLARDRLGDAADSPRLAR